MKRTRRTLAVLAFTTLVSCSAPAPASPPIAATITLRLYATTPVTPLVEDLTSAYVALNPSVKFETQSGNYQNMIDRLMTGEMPYFVSNHLPLESQSALNLWAAPIGQDGIAIITHPANSINELTSEQLRNIYQGHVSNWRDIGGSDLGIVVISRERGSGTRAEFEQQIMGSRRTTQGAQIAPSSAAVISSVANLPGSIGYVSMSYLNETVKALALDGVLPTGTAVADNTYPLRSTIFVVGLVEPDDAYRAFIGWIQSPAGQTVVGRRYATGP